MDFNNSNFFDKPNSRGSISGFRDMNSHVSAFKNNEVNHMTFHKNNSHDFSLETRVNLYDYEKMGCLEKRTTFLDAYHSPLNMPTPPMSGGTFINPASMLGGY